MRRAQYSVVNGSGLTLAFFGTDYRAAKQFCTDYRGVGLRYSLRVKRYYVTT